MQRLISLFAGTFAASGTLAHEIAGADGLLQSVHAASSPHHWTGLLLLVALAVILYRFVRRVSRTE